MKLSLILWLFKSLGFNLQDLRGLPAKTRDGGLILGNPRVSYAKLPREGVSGTLDHTIPSGRTRLDLVAERAASADRWARGVSDTGQGWQAGPSGRGAGGGESEERSDLDRRAEIRSARIKSKSHDLERMSEIQQPVAKHERGGAARSHGEVSPETRGTATVGL
jgi:hypothetical protein